MMVSDKENNNQLQNDTYNYSYTFGIFRSYKKNQNLICNIWAAFIGTKTSFHFRKKSLNIKIKLIQSKNFMFSN